MDIHEFDLDYTPSIYHWIVSQLPLLCKAQEWGSTKLRSWRCFSLCQRWAPPFIQLKLFTPAFIKVDQSQVESRRNRLHPILHSALKMLQPEKMISWERFPYCPFPLAWKLPPSLTLQKLQIALLCCMQQLRQKQQKRKQNEFEMDWYEEKMLITKAIIW